ncbi:MAG: MFS transporter [Patescibacteria group bacterium]
MKTFYQLLANNLIASITNFTVWFAVIFFVYLETKSVFATSMLAGIYLVMTISSGFWFGSIVDHHRKKTAMLISSYASLAIYIISFIIYLTADPSVFKNVSSVTLWIFCPLILIGIIFGNIRNVAMPTTITLLIPEDRRDKANGLVGTTFGISFLIVSVISGFLVGMGGMYYVLILAITMTIAAIIHLLCLDLPEDKILHITGQPKTIDIRGTMKVIKTIPGLFALILFATFNNFLGGVFMSLMDGHCFQKWRLKS